MGFSFKNAIKGAVSGFTASGGNPWGAVGGAAFGGFAGNSDKKEARSDYLWQLQQQEASNIRLWNLQNAYNTPAQQMARFKEAGLNPNLIYGQTNTASPISSASADYNEKDTAQQNLGNYIALSNLGLQKDANSLQAWNAQQNVALRNRDMDLREKQFELEEKTQPLKLALMQSQLDGQNAGILNQWFGKDMGDKMYKEINDFINRKFAEFGWDLQL